MKEYMQGVFLAALLVSFLNHISYKSALDGARKFALGLILLTVVSTPILSALEDLPNSSFEALIPGTEDIPEGTDGIYEEAFCLGIREAVAAKFELKPSEIRVLTDGFSASEWRCGRMRIILSGRAALADYRRIEEYIEKLELGECEVEIEIG